MIIGVELRSSSWRLYVRKTKNMGFRSVTNYPITLTLPQPRAPLATVLPLRSLTIHDALKIVQHHTNRNYRAYQPHRKKRGWNRLSMIIKIRCSNMRFVILISEVTNIPFIQPQQSSSRKTFRMIVLVYEIQSVKVKKNPGRFSRLQH
jgi:hypothetical protein